MNPLLYAAVGFAEWYLALRRTLACAQGQRIMLVVIVFIENLLGLWVLSNFVRANNWWLALAYAAGSALGALFATGRPHDTGGGTSRVGAISPPC